MSCKHENLVLQFRDDEEARLVIALFQIEIEVLQGTKENLTGGGIQYSITVNRDKASFIKMVAIGIIKKMSNTVNPNLN